METKIYVDGFWIDAVEFSPEADIETAAVTPKVTELIEGRTIQSIIPLPEDHPRVVLITTEL